MSDLGGPGHVPGPLSRRGAALLAALVLAAVAAGALAPGIYSVVGLPALLQQIGLTGLLVLGQQLALRSGLEDLSVGALMALAGALAVGLSEQLGTGSVLAAAAAVAGVSAAMAGLVHAVPRRTALVTLLPVLLVPALLPVASGRFLAPGLELALEARLGPVPGLLLLCLAAWLAALILRPTPGPTAALMVQAGIAVVLGLSWASEHGAPAAVPMWPVGLGLGLALLVDARPQAANVEGLLVAALAAVLFAVLDERLQVGAAALPVVSGVLMAAGLWRARAASAHADDLDQHAVHIGSARIRHDDAELAGLAGLDER